MVEVPAKGASGISLSTISDEESAQFTQVLGKLENYSANLIESFDSSLKQIRGKLDTMGGTAIKALDELSKARAALENVTDQSCQELEQIMDCVNEILSEMDCLDSVQADILRLSDAVATVESSIKSQ